MRTLIIFGTVLGATAFLLIIGKPGYEALGLFLKAGEAARLQPNVLAQIMNVRLEIFQKGLLLALFLSAGGLAAMWLGWRGTLKGGTVGLLLLGLLVTDLWVVDREFLHLRNPGNLRQQFRATPEVQFLQKDESLFRILPLDDFNTNWYGYFGLSSVGGYRPVKLRTYQDLMDAGGMNNPSVLNMLNVKYIITRRDIESEQFRRVFKGNKSVYRNMSVLPRAWMVDNIVSVSNQEESLEKTLDPEFDPSRTAVVIDYRGPEPSQLDESRVEVTRFSENEIALETSAEDGRLLVLSENYFGPGWKASIDGRESKIYQTDHVLRSVYVPPGNHTVIFRYDTRLFRATRMVSRLSLIGILVALAFLHRDALGSFLSVFRRRDE
ncbi:MAG: YfhO family protein [Fidelibacterota bacterium]